MDLEARMHEVTVIGAAGKMGSGISLLMAVAMAKQKLRSGGSGRFRLNLVDTSPDALVGLVEYLREQALRAAEKSIVEIRDLYRDRDDLVENSEIVDAFALDVGRVTFPSTDAGVAKDSAMVFEAIVENEDVKTSVYQKLRETCPAHTFFFTNTSSVPISLLDERAHLDGRIIGFHFYNPPPVQKLVEVITSAKTRPDLVALSEELGRALGKKLIGSNDVAGFIGNGHFIPDALHAFGEVARLCAEGMPYVEAVYAVNRVSQDFLVRPMGIFQLVDYVGIDVFSCISKVMSRHRPGTSLESPLIDRYLARGVRGGQLSSGAQRDGFLQYEKGAPVAIYDVDAGQYEALGSSPETWSRKVDEKLGPPPPGWRPWKKMMALPDRDRKAALEACFKALWAMDTKGADLARRYAVRSREIAESLVREGVAHDVEDVNGVLLHGFYHAYGPVSDFIPAAVAATEGVR